MPTQTDREALRLMTQTVMLLLSEAAQKREEEPKEKDSAEPRAGRWPEFSPLEAEIITVVPVDRWMTTPEIGALLDEPGGSDLPAVLRNLAARGVLRPSKGRGFMLIPPGTKRSCDAG